MEKEEKVRYSRLKIGERKEGFLKEDQIWQHIHSFFYHGKNSSTYKFGFFKALLETVSDVNVQNELTFDQVFRPFTKIYWNLVVHHKLWQSNNTNRMASVQRVIEEFHQKYEIPDEWNFDRIETAQQDQLIRKVKQAGKINVIGAMFGDFEESIYSFNIKEEKITMNELYVDFFLKFKRILKDINNYQLAMFLEKYNEAEKVSNLLSTVELVSQRKSLKEFENILRQAGVHSCFYCGKELKNNAHVDHFIPWSYIQNDRLWNFVLACQSCNSKKSNKLAPQEAVERIIARNELMVCEEKYSSYFTNYDEEKILTSYRYSEANGFKHL